jgi:hypothetical protein
MERDYPVAVHRIHRANNHPASTSAATSTTMRRRHHLLSKIGREGDARERGREGKRQIRRLHL